MLLDVNDSYRLASKLTPKRIANAWKVWASYHKAKLLSNPEIKGFPISVAIEPTTACNLRCPECPSGLRSFTRPTGSLIPEMFRKTIEELSDTLVYLTFYFQGEPYLNPDFLKMVRIASDRNIYTTTSTNAHFLTDDTARKTIASGLDRLIISIDGSSKETYEAYRKGGRLEKVLEGTRRVIRWKRKLKSPNPRVVWQFLVVRPNEHQIPDVKQLAGEYGVDKVVFKTAQIYDYKNGSDLIPTIDKYSRYKKNADGSWSIKSKRENKCWKMWNSCVITWDGKVIPCCFDKDAKHSFGSVRQASFHDIWQSRNYYLFRKALLTSRSTIEICKNCTEGLKVFRA